MSASAMLHFGQPAAVFTGHNKACLVRDASLCDEGLVKSQNAPDVTKRIITRELLCQTGESFSSHVQMADRSAVKDPWGSPLVLEHLLLHSQIRYAACNESHGCLGARNPEKLSPSTRRVAAELHPRPCGATAEPATSCCASGTRARRRCAGSVPQSVVKAESITAACSCAMARISADALGLTVSTSHHVAHPEDV
jgi:hypothetical protein